MKVAFNTLWGYKEKEIEVTINIGTLEAASKGLGIEFFQVSKSMQDDIRNFSIEILWQGYITACKNRYKKPKYTRSHAMIWYEKMSKEATKEFVDKMTGLFGELTKASVSKKKIQRTKQPGQR